MQSVPISTKVASSNPADGEVYSIQLYVIELSVTCGRSVVFSGYSVCSTNKTDHHDIDELLFKVALDTTTLAPTRLAVLLLSGIRRDLHYHVIKRIDQI